MCGLTRTRISSTKPNATKYSVFFHVISSELHGFGVSFFAVDIISPPCSRKRVPHIRSIRERVVNHLRQTFGTYLHVFAVGW